MMNDDITTLEIVLLGDSGVGKTAILDQYINKNFAGNYANSIRFDIHSKCVVVDDVAVKLRFMDTAGQERFRSVGSSLYRKADCCVLVYDVTDSDSFSNLDMWRREFLMAANIKNPSIFPCILIGNKIDLPRKVETCQAEAWCHAMNRTPYFECSAKDNTNIEQAFLSLARQALLTDFVKVDEYPDVVVLERERMKARSRCRC